MRVFVVDVIVVEYSVAYRRPVSSSDSFVGCSARVVAKS